MKQQNWIVGCFGLQKDGQNILDSIRHQLPLKKIDTFVQIINGVAEVQLHQTFFNDREVFLQVEYKFPIMPDACLYKFLATFGKTRMEGVVKQKQTAKTEYAEAVTAGKRAALGSVDPQSKDIFILKIGNIGPFEEVKIQLCYTEELLICLNTFYQFNFASKLLPGYINNIPQQSFLNAFRSCTIIGKIGFEWDFKLKLSSSRKIISYQSTTHQITLEKSNDPNTELELTLSKGELLSKDFSIFYTFEGFQIPSYTLGRTDVSSSVMVSFIPKFCSLDLKDAELAAIKSDDFETDMDAVRGQYVFLLDRSYSMGGPPIQKAKQALIIFLKSLPIDTYFQVISFGSTSSRIFKVSRKNSNENIEQAIKAIEQMSANMGGTEIFKPLSDIYKAALIEGYPKQVFLLTDGQVSETDQVIDLVGKNTKYSRTHTIGFGRSVSKPLILGCAKKGKGRHVFIDDKQDPSQKIIQLLNDSLTAVISKVSLKYEAGVVESIVPNPDTIPYILKGEIVNFYITFRGQLAHPTTISLSYVDSLNGLPFKSQLEISPDSPCQAFVDKLGNYRRIKAFEEAEDNKNSSDFVYYVKITDWKQKIIELSTKHQILSKHTAFLCAEKELIDGRYEQMKAKGQQRTQIQEDIQIIDILFDPIFSPSYQFKPSSYALPPPPPLPQNLLPPLPPPSQVHMPRPPPPSIRSTPMPIIQMNQPSNSYDFQMFGVATSPPGSIYAATASENQASNKKYIFNNLFCVGASDGASPQIQQKASLPPTPPFLQATANIQASQSQDLLGLFGLPTPPPPPPPSFSLPPPPPHPKSSNYQPFLDDFFSKPSPLRSVADPLSRPPPLSAPSQSIMQDLKSKIVKRSKAMKPSSSDEEDAQQKMEDIQKMNIFQENVLFTASNKINKKKALFDDDQDDSFFASKPIAKKKGLFEDDAGQVPITKKIETKKKNLLDDDEDQIYTPKKIVTNKKNVFDDEDYVLVPKKIETTQFSIKQVVGLQQFEGKWSRLDLIEKLFSPALASRLANIVDRDVAITLLVAGWIQKHHKEKVYSLILKKAMNWLKKQQRYQQYVLEYQQYIQ